MIFDPPYAVSALRSVAGKTAPPDGYPAHCLSMQRTMSLCARALRPGGIIFIFGDYKRLPDLMYAATTSGLRLSGCVAWVGPGPALAACSGPPGIRSRSPPGNAERVDRAAVRNVMETGQRGCANYPAKRTHPYEKPPEALAPILARVSAPATSSSTRSPGRAAPVTPPGSWISSGSAATSTRSSQRRRHRRPRREVPYERIRV